MLRGRIQAQAKETEFEDEEKIMMIPGAILEEHTRKLRNQEVKELFVKWKDLQQQNELWRRILYWRTFHS